MSSILKMLARAGAVDLAYSVGTPAHFGTAQIQRTSIGVLGATSAIIFFSDFTNNRMAAVVATISGTTVTYGAIALVNAAYAPPNINTCALTATSGIFAYEDSAGNQLATRGFTISGTTITVGGEVLNGAVSQQPSLARLTDTTAICTYQGATNAVIVSLSGATTSYGAAVNPAGNANSQINVVALSSTKAIIAFDNSADTNKPTVHIVTISGTTITLGTSYAVDGAIAVTTSSGYVGVTALSDSLALVCFNESVNGYPKAVAMTISGQTPTFGASLQLDTVAYTVTGAGRPLSRFSAAQALFLITNTNLYGVILSVTGTTVSKETITLVNNYSTRAVSLDVLVLPKFLCAFGTGTTNGTSETITIT